MLRNPTGMAAGLVCLTIAAGCSTTSARQSVRPYADMSNGIGTVDAIRLRGRVVMEPGDLVPETSTPLSDLSQSEIDDASITVSLRDGTGNQVDLGEFTCDEEGYLDARIELVGHGLSAGVYEVNYAIDGEPAGASTVHLLSPDVDRVIIRSDVDLTYLHTDFSTKRAMWRLLRQNARARTTLPAMEVVFGGLRRGADGSGNRPVTFLSGSPRFFKRVIESKFALDGVRQDGVVLKPFKAIVAEHLSSFEPGSVIPALKEQIGYKLEWLLRLRLEANANVSEVLLGDDSEADVVVYTLYFRLLTGELNAAGLDSELERLSVAKGFRVRIAQLAPLVLTHVGEQETPVRAIYINKTGHAGSHHSVDAWSVPRTRYHAGAWPLALDLWDEGLIAEADVAAVYTRLRALGQTPQTINEAELQGVDAGFLEPEHTARAPRPEP